MDASDVVNKESRTEYWGMKCKRCGEKLPASGVCPDCGPLKPKIKNWEPPRENGRAVQPEEIFDAWWVGLSPSELEKQLAGRYCEECERPMRIRMVGLCMDPEKPNVPTVMVPMFVCAICYDYVNVDDLPEPGEKEMN